jgi:hypothetical protein
LFFAHNLPKQKPKANNKLRNYYTAPLVFNMVDRVKNFQSQEIRFLDETIVISGHVPRHQLPADFQPSPWSVVCGRGKSSLSHVGNQRLRVLVECHLAAYSAATTKMEKTTIVTTIVDTVREAAQDGAFVKLDNKTGRYIETGDAAAREKVGQLFRELLTKQDPVKIQQRKDARKARRAMKKQKLARSESDSSNSSVSSYDSGCMSTDSETSVTSDSQPQVMPSLDFDPLPLDMACDQEESFNFTGFQKLQFL